MASRVAFTVLLSLLLSSVALARTLKTDKPALDIQVPCAAGTGGNGQPLELTYPGGSVVVAKDNGCGKKGVVVDVEHPAGGVGVQSGNGCKPAKVDVDAPGTAVTVEKASG